MTPCTGQSSPSAVDVLCCSFLWCDCCGALVISLFWFVVSLPPFLLPAPVSFANTLHSHWPIRGAVVMSCCSFLYCGCCGALVLSCSCSLCRCRLFYCGAHFFNNSPNWKKILCNNNTVTTRQKEKEKEAFRCKHSSPS